MSDAPEPQLTHEVTTEHRTITTYQLVPHANPNEATVIGPGCAINPTVLAPPSTIVPPDIVAHVHVREEVSFTVQVRHPGLPHLAVHEVAPE